MNFAASDFYGIRSTRSSSFLSVYLIYSLSYLSTFLFFSFFGGGWTSRFVFWILLLFLGKKNYTPHFDHELEIFLKNLFFFFFYLSVRKWLCSHFL